MHELYHTIGYHLHHSLSNHLFSFHKDKAAKIIRMRLIPSNQQQQRIIHTTPMNIASFLHSQKEYQDSHLPLPLAPVYELPHHRWIFSSHTLVPLRKRKENTSLYQYIEELDHCIKQNANNDQYKDGQQSILCLYEKNGYWSEKIKHVFETIWRQSCKGSRMKEKFECICCSEPQENIKIFKTNINTLCKHLQQSKHPKRETTMLKQDQINWFQLTQNLVHSNLKLQFFSQDHLHLYKLPHQQQNNCIFNVLWNNSYIVFNNGTQIKINQHMKTKAVELAELIGKKLQDYLWRNMQIHIEQKAEEIQHHEEFVQKVRKMVTPNSFRLWFYKKEKNNEIYAMAVTDITLKGVDCTLFKNINMKTEIIIDTSGLPIIPQDQIVSPIDRFLNNRIKSYSLQSKSNHSLRAASNRQKLRNILESNISSKTLEVHQQSVQKSKEQYPTDVQCVCCKNLLLANEIINEITAKHIDEIKYFRQIKIGKKQYDDYDFVKVCSKCYEAYLKCYRNGVNRAKEKKTVSFYQYKKNKEQSIAEAKKSNSVSKKSQAKKQKIGSDSSRRLLRNQSYNTRAKSELDTSKELTDANNLSKDIERVYLKPRIPTASLSSKYKKNKTTYTSNTDTLDMEPVRKIPSIREEFTIERSFTDKEPQNGLKYPKQSILKSRSFKLRGRVASKDSNLLNRIILNTYGDENSQGKSEAGQFFDENQMIKDQILSKAIQEYQNISRPSFKKLLYKNYRTINKKEIVEQLDENQQSQINWRRKSIKSYCQQ